MDATGLLDSSALNRRYWLFACSVAAAAAFEYFDLFLVGYVVSLLAPQWNLTFGQSSIILMSSGVGALLGAVLAGMATNRFGRKPVLLASLIICSVATCSMAAVPTGAWLTLSALRFVVGAAVPALHLTVITLVVELTPTSRRTSLSSLMAIAMVPIGGLLAALAGANSSILGWQGLCLLGGIAVIFAPVLWFTVPESPQWLVSRNRISEAEAVLARFTGSPVRLTVAPIKVVEPADNFWSALAGNPARTCLIIFSWFGISTVSYGMVLWGPTLVRLVLNTTPSQAASLFVAVGFGGLTGRILASLIAGRLGRRLTGAMFAGCSALALIATSIFYDSSSGGFAVFLPMFVVAYALSDGGWANAGPMPSELFPTSLRSQAGALSQFINALGKMVGPMILGVVAGTGDLVTPKATLDALQPAFLTLAVFSGVVSCTFLLAGIETHGVSLSTLDEPGGGTADPSINGRAHAHCPEPAGMMSMRRPTHI
jgi:putative MFS transporter